MFAFTVIVPSAFKVKPVGTVTGVKATCPELVPITAGVPFKVSFKITLGVLCPSAIVAGVSSTASIVLGVEEELLFKGVGSLSKPLIIAVFVYDPVELTVATTVKVAETPLARLPIDQVDPVNVPTEGVALTRVYPDGNASVTETPVPSFGPLLVAVIVKVTFEPALALKGLADFVTAKSD